MNLFEWIDLPSLGDDRGSLIVFEGSRAVPFEINRVYYMFGTKQGVTRGFHAHKNLLQVAVCIVGKCRMIFDDGVNREDTWLDSPSKGLFIKNMVWHEMHDFSDDCVLLVLASDHYDETDYIREYGEFIELCGHE